MLLKTTEETKQFGKKFAEKVQFGGVICLYGDLGAGKTTFTQGLAQGLGVQNRIISPTFVIVRTYEIKRKINNVILATERSPESVTGADAGQASMTSQNFYHIDLYRTNSEQELIDIGLQEILDNPENIVVIEWAEKLGALLHENRWDITFAYTENQQRIVELRSF